MGVGCRAAGFLHTIYSSRLRSEIFQSTSAIKCSGKQAILWLPIELTGDLRQNMLPTPSDSSGIQILVCINRVIYNKNKRAALESLEGITAVWEPTASQGKEWKEGRENPGAFVPK